MEPTFEPYKPSLSYGAMEMVARARAFRDSVRTRRTVREYASDDVPMDAVMACIEAAASAPSGANKQPWHFVVVTDAAVKSRIREAAEREERAFYEERAPEEWLRALRSLGTDHHKPFLESAPVLIAVFARVFERSADGRKHKNYYVRESVGIATGILLTALHLSGFSTLTHTPSPMGFLNTLLERPREEQAFLLLVLGRPAPDARVPIITKKSSSEYITHV